MALVVTLLLRDKDLARRTFSPGPLALLLVPVGTWIWLYYQQGGVCYLHEHFVNNILGRFLRHHFELEGCRFYHTDLGNKAPWYFYLQRSSDMLGLALLFLPPAIWMAGRKSMGQGDAQDRFPGDGLPPCPSLNRLRFTLLIKKITFLH